MPSQRQEFTAGTESALEAGRRAFEGERPGLMGQYAGQYVALLNGRVVDNDKNDEDLAERMFKKFGDAPFYIGRVEDPPSVYELPSPELAR